MKIRLLILGLCAMLVIPAFAQQQEVDVTKLMADTKTFIFSNNKNTVKTYIYDEMEAKTTCCGSDRIYLEIKIDPSGYVLQAKTLTGKSDCYKKSAIDIVKNIKWDAKGFKGPKSVYFEIKPEVECNDDRTNTYAALPLFNNEVLDENGVPLSYASSSGVSASAASGTSITPTGVPATPANPKPRPSTTSSAGVGGDESAVASNQTKPATPAKNTGSSGAGTDETMASAAKPNTTTNTSDSELEKAKTMAKMESANQDDEIERLKRELAEMKKTEGERAKIAQAAADKEAEKARREEAAKERKRIQELQTQKEERAEREREKREAARARENKQVASNDRNRNNDGYQGGFQDVDYGDEDGGGSDSKRGGGYDYSDERGSRGSRDTDPPRAQTAEERARADKAKLEQELQEIKRKMQDDERAARTRQSELERNARDLARIEEQILRKDEEARKAAERTELERIETQRREADDRKRKMEQEVQRQMDDLKRMQMDMDRKLADLKRLEEETQRKELEKQQREQEITQQQTVRQQEMEAEIERKKLMVGGASSGQNVAIGSSPFPTFSGGDSLSGNGVALLAAQIEQLRRDILNLQMAVGGGGQVTNVGSLPSTPRNTRSAGIAVSTSGEKSAAADNSWRNAKYNKEGVTYATSSPTVPGGDLRPDPSHAGTHVNVPGPRLGTPSYPGGAKAMNSMIIDKLKEAGQCGMVEAMFELDVDGAGNVVKQRILSVNAPEVQFQLPTILQGIKFAASGNRFNQTLYSSFKAEIVCETPAAPQPAAVPQPATEMPEDTNQ